MSPVPQDRRRRRNTGAARPHGRAAEESRGPRARRPAAPALADLPGLLPRAAAALALRRVERDRAYVTRALEDAWRESGGEATADRAAATELALGAWRWRGILDARLDPLLPRGLASLDDLTRQVLRVAAYELLGPHPTAAHGAVHVAVEAATRLRSAALGGLANAVLRRLARTAAESAGRGSHDDRAALALPPWLRERFADAWGTPTANALAGWSLAAPGRSVRLNGNRTSPGEALAAFPGSTPSPYSPRILRLPAGAGDLREHPCVAAGRATVQEEGAALCADSLPLPPAGRVLDACAGRGTKTTALAERAPAGTRLWAADVNPDKLARLGPEMTRLGLPAVETVAVDWSVGTAGLTGPFDAVLVDAPCSGTGTLSRRPEIRWRLEPVDVARLAQLQAAILARTAACLAVEGCLLYVVCSLLPEEGPRQVEALLAASPDLALADQAFAAPPWRPLAHGAVLLPPESGTDGFFAALVRRRR